jgi:hypothetical protein
MSTTFVAADIRRLAEQVGMTDEVDLDRLRRGLTIELVDNGERPAHVTGDDPLTITKIAIARPHELPDDCDHLARPFANKHGDHAAA